MTNRRACLALLIPLVVPAGSGLAAPVLSRPPEPVAMQSPWWENYDQTDRFLCDRRISLVLERNASQASLISGGSRSLLFRESSDAPGLRYRNDQMLIVLRGDELLLERLPQQAAPVAGPAAAGR